MSAVCGVLLFSCTAVCAGANPVISYDGASESGNLAPGTWAYYEVTVPANAEGFKITLEGAGTGEPDLYLQVGQDPTTVAYSNRSLDVAADAIILTNTTGVDRIYQVGVHVPVGDPGSADYTLETHGDFFESTLAWDDGSTLLGTAPASLSTSAGGLFYYKVVTVAPVLDVWRAALKITSGEAHLYAKQNTPPTTTSFTLASEQVGDDGFTRQLSHVSGGGQIWFLLVEATPGAQFELLAGDVHVADLGVLAADASSGSGSDTIPAEGARFYKSSIPSGALAWRLWLQDAAGTTTWAHDFFVRKGLAPHSSSSAYHDKQRHGQGLLVPDFLAPGGGDLYYVGIWGDPGETFQLDSRQQEIVDIAFDGTVPVAVTNSFRFKSYRVSVPVDQIAWEVALTPGAGDPNLAVRRDQVPNPFNNDAFSEVADPTVADSISLVPPDLSDGTFFITTYSAADYSGTLGNHQPVITPIDYATTIFDPLNPQNHSFAVLNDDPDRAGWRYFVVSNVETPQLGSLGWLLELENQAPGTEIAIRRNFVPGRQNYRQDGSVTIYQTIRSDASSDLGFLQHREHESDIWYVGIHSPNQALGSFTLKSGHEAPGVLAMDAGATTVPTLNPGAWQFYRVDVPAQSGGEEVLGWEVKVTSWSGSRPVMVVRRDSLAAIASTSGYWDLPYPPRTPYKWNALWQSSEQWAHRSYDWTGRTYSADGSQTPESYGMWAAMNHPLLPGTYYVGFYNDSLTTPSSYTFTSKAIGTGMSHDPQLLAFDGGVAAISNLPAREVAYYYVDIPANTASWRVSLSADSGECALYVNQGTLPTSQTSSTSYSSPFAPLPSAAGELARLQKSGDEHYTLLPPLNESVLPEDRYYLMVVSEGQGPTTSWIGTGSSSATLTSHGLAEAPTDLGTVGVGTDLVHNDSYALGRLKFHTFTVPAGVNALEVRLENRVGDPWMSALYSDGDAGFGNTYGYGYSTGRAGTRSESLITLSNPIAGSVWRLVVMDPSPESDWSTPMAAGSYTLRVTAVGELPLTLDGGGDTVTAQSPGAWSFYQVDIPAQIAGEDVLGWELKVTDWSGHRPTMVVRQDSLPSSQATSGYWGLNYAPRYPYKWGALWGSGEQWAHTSFDWTGRTYSADGIQTPESYGMWAAMGHPLVPGTYYVGFYNASASVPSNFTFTSRAIGTGMEHDPQPLAFTGGVASTGNLPAREVAYYSVDIPANTPSWRVSLTADSGECALYIHEGSIPTSQTTGYSYDSPYDYAIARLQKEGDEQYTLQPEYNETFLREGRYYLMVVSEGQSPASASRIGTGTSAATLTSHGVAEAPIDLGTVVVGADITHSDSYELGRLNRYLFTVPSGINALEVRLENRVGDPKMWALYSDGDSGFPVTYGYGHFSGRSYYPDGGTSDSIITLNNPMPGSVWRLVVMDPASLNPNPPTAGSYTLRVTAVGELPLSLDGGGDTITGQSPGTWRFYKVDVPAQINGEDVLGWEVKVTSWSGARPTMVVSRDSLPTGVTTSTYYGAWGPATWYRPYHWTSRWGSGAQWAVKSGDWTVRSNSADGAQANESYGIWAAMDHPLEAGSYYVAFYNESTTDPSTFTFTSKAIGTGMALSPQPLAFAGGSASTGSLAAREVAYYSVDIPAGTPSWRVSLGADSGESALYIHQSSIPTSETLAYPTSTPFSYDLVRLPQDGGEHYTLMPPANESTLPEGRYYLMAVSEGQSPISPYHIGTGTSAATVTSHGIAPVQDLGLLSLGSQFQLAAGFDPGDIDLIQFELPPGTPAIEVRLEDRVGNPVGSLGWTGPNFPRGYSYGYSSGQTADRSAFTRTTIANPTAGNYRLVVVDPATLNPTPPTTGAYTLVVSSLIPPTLNFAASQSGNGLSNMASGTLADDERAFYKIEVPATVAGVPVMGWRLEIPATAGEPEIRVRKGSLPEGTEANGGSLTAWAQRSLIVATPELEPGTWYVEVKGGGATEFDLISEALTLERGAWTMPLPGAPTSTPGLSAPTFGDSGVDEAGLPLAGDQGLDLENGRYDYYAIDIPEGNGGLVRVQLEAINGNPDLYLRHGAVPSIDHLSPPYGSPGYAAFDYVMNAASQTEYGNFVPFDGKTETQLQPGRWYLAVRAGGNTNARYRLRVSRGAVDDLALDGGVASSQLLAAGDWRYYRVVIPEDAPIDWSVTFTQEQGDVDLLLRDTIPPGQNHSFPANSRNVSSYQRDWSADAKNPGIPSPYSQVGVGTYTFSPPAVRPGSVYFLGFKANADSVFAVSSAVGAESIGVLPEIAFADGSINIAIPPSEQRSYKVVAPPSALRWSHTSIRSSNIELRIEQGSVPALSGVVDYTSSATNGYYSRDLQYWPWVPDQTYYLTFINHGVGSEPLQFTMQGEAGLTYAEWAGDHGLSPDPGLAHLDNNDNGISDLLEFALQATGASPSSALPQAVVTGDRLAIRFLLPAGERSGLTLSVDASPDLSPGSWLEIAAKSGANPWTGSVVIQETVLGDLSTEVTVMFPASFIGQVEGFLRLRATLE